MCNVTLDTVEIDLNIIGIFALFSLLSTLTFFVSKVRITEVLTESDFKMMSFLNITDHITAISHIYYTISEQNIKVNLFLKVQKPFILTENVKQLSNLMT